MTDPTTVADTNIIGWIKDINIQAAIVGPIITTAISSITYTYRQKQKGKVEQAKLIQKIERLAVAHWCSPSTDANNKMRGINIFYELKILSWKIDPDNPAHRKAMVAYRKAITGGEFDNPTRPELNFNDPRMDLIRQAAKGLRKALKIKKEH